MRIIYGILLFIFVSSTAWAVDWFPIGAKWTWTSFHTVLPDIEYYTVEITKDTFITNKFYKKAEVILYKASNPNGISQPNATIYFNEENGKITYRYKDVDYRLYDYSLAAGDTMYTDMTLFCNNFASRIPNDHDTVLIAKHIVDSIKTITIDGEILKQLVLHPHIDTSNTPPHYKGTFGLQDNFSIIEKIGLENSVSFFGYVSGMGILLGGFYGYLRCYEDNTISYKTRDFDCNYINSITSINNNEGSYDLNIYPNPATHTIYISNHLENATIVIVDIQGNNILQKYNCSEKELDISSLGKGFYILSIIHDGKTYTSKFIKSD